jgi:hypothetical protein
MFSDKMLDHKNIKGTVVFAVKPELFQQNPTIIIWWLDVMTAHYKACCFPMRFREDLEVFYELHREKAQQDMASLSATARLVLESIMQCQSQPANGGLISSLTLIHHLHGRSHLMTYNKNGKLSIKYSLKNDAEKRSRIMTLRSNPLVDFGDEAGRVCLNALCKALTREEKKPVRTWNLHEFGFGEQKTISNRMESLDAITYGYFIHTVLGKPSEWVTKNYDVIKSVCDYYVEISENFAKNS